ncbi:hypothetical protein, partial [Zhongshania sp.]|uniref:hypothetical protein n=1 Tax=Zhongshania sp. TaxID=1971902 RepID=UPI0035654D66
GWPRWVLSDYTTSLAKRHGRGVLVRIFSRDVLVWRSARGKLQRRIGGYFRSATGLTSRLEQGGNVVALL